MAEFFPRVEPVVQQFDLAGELLSIEEVQTGLINSTYVVSFVTADGARARYIVQQINAHVFPDPRAVMMNVSQVLDHIAEKSPQVDSNQLLRLFPSKLGEPYVVADDGGVWRCYNFIEGCCTYDVVSDVDQAYTAAYAFGDFQNKLSDFPLSRIVEVIPDFHHTPKRYQSLVDALKADSFHRAQGVKEELAFIEQREKFIHHFIRLRDEGAIPIRLTHNDTKFNNVMVDEETGKAVCVIDLDTVMPGLSLYDFGDLVRTSVSPASEDSVEGICVRIPIFNTLVDGYLDACDCLCDAELENLAVSAKLITLELAIRFLTDYLEGDVYFKTEYLQQNLQRAKVQLALVEKLEACEEEMISYVRERSSS